jgi:CHAD domain-containing protein
MGYRLIQDEPLSRGLKRIARDEIDSAVAQLGTKDPAQRDHAVHEARKSIKKLRGLLRMLAPMLGASADTEIAALGDLGRSLTELRDAAALVETTDMLGHHCRDEIVLGQLAELRTRLRRRAKETAEKAEVDGTLRHGITSLRQLKRSAANWKLEDSFDVIAPGLKKSYRRGRAAFAEARDAGTAETFHDLRKRVKDRWYQVRILEGIWSHPAHAPEKALRDLQEDLGDDHNLEELRAFIHADSAALLELVELTQKDFRRKALTAAKDLYNRKPREVVEELKSLWEEWLSPSQRAKSAASTRVRASSAA